MTPFVLDCSVSAAWCLVDESSEAARRLLLRLTDTEARVPALWISEMANTLAVAERRGRIDAADVGLAVDQVGLLPIRLDAGHPDMLARVVRLSRETGLSAYDASYLELAQRRGLPLATFDRRLREVARSAGVALVPTES